MRYGFVIDQRRCIGCHACTVACKEENQVPLGVNRTWVKYIEKGTFPDTRRYFSVMRCNHCDNAPCVTICPTVALYRRPDGIVDFDGGRCIGCKACMQACPYAALYTDPEPGTAAKCHYCAHGVEVGLEPACVVVCPVQAIIAGDLDDPETTIARLVASQPTQVRKPEQGTQPKLFYLGAEEAALTPDAGALRGLRVRPGEPDSRPGHVQRGGERRRGRRGRAAGGGSSEARADGLRRGPSRATLGMESLHLSLDQVGGRRRFFGVGPGADGRARLGRRRDRAGRTAHRPALPRTHHHAARLRPQAPGALPLSLVQAQLALLAGLGRLDPGGVWRRGRPLAPRGLDRPRHGASDAGLAHGAAGRGGRGLQRLPLRPGRG